MPQEKEIKDSKNPESNNRSIVSVLYSRIYKLKIERAEKEEINNENEEFNFLIHFLEGIKDLLLREYVQRFQVPGLMSSWFNLF